MPAFTRAQRPDLAESVLQAKLLDVQRTLSVQIGDAVFVRVDIAYDGLFTVELSTPDRDHGYAESFDLDEALHWATAMLHGTREARLAYLAGRIIPALGAPPAPGLSD